MKKLIKYFTKFEWALLLSGIVIITVGFFVGEDKNYLSLVSSLFGITMIIVNAKGSVYGQVLAIVFSLTYAILAYTKAYYGEMIIYLTLMLPIHIVSIITWLKNRNEKAEHLEVKINSLSKKEYVFFSIGCVVTTIAFYFLLRALHTDNLEVSTISLITSLAAAYLMLRRSEYFSLMFIFNDVILIILWSMKIATDGISVLPSVLSFTIFLINDGYSFYSWKKIKRRQRQQ